LGFGDFQDWLNHKNAVFTDPAGKAKKNRVQIAQGKNEVSGLRGLNKKTALQVEVSTEEHSEPAGFYIRVIVQV
jgi:hypothetical protein